ncbi:GGDEF domain-containing protein [Ureibacillus chungkukjangi]|uniref:Diguanylate cyclase (GGDEF)-like protein n=1 Tax=Ureibacillus chungkukjangi TaxID=1202712 RepID=A0A318TVP1_9BACL|nr:GGDEF domain-containing protein [Ureibacillus chungkukjangi]PYF07917.1 diguanylate cyclase (GGDEF)-like protein [Ureibacillus chungkukjangi]
MNGKELMHRQNSILFILVSVFYFIQIMVSIVIGGFESIYSLAMLFLVFAIIPIVLIYIKVNPKITMYVIVSSMYLFFYCLLKDRPYLVNYLFMWLVLPLCALYQNARLVVIAGIASTILTFYAFFYLREEIFPNVVIEDFIYLVMFGVFTTIFLLIFIRKISEVNDKLQQLAYQDPLTGAANRLLLKEKFNFLKEKRTHSVALLFIDMNGFKKINDTYGHEVGDQLLKRVVSRLGDELTDTDLLCRLGGDEFVILSSNIENSFLESLVERVQMALDEAISLNHQTIKVSGSIGWSYTTDISQADLETMIRDADSAMYRAKGSELQDSHSTDIVKD